MVNTGIILGNGSIKISGINIHYQTISGIIYLDYIIFSDINSQIILGMNINSLNISYKNIDLVTLLVISLINRDLLTISEMYLNYLTI